jgi:hypothetical protein
MMNVLDMEGPDMAWDASLRQKTEDSPSADSLVKTTKGRGGGVNRDIETVGRDITSQTDRRWDLMGPRLLPGAYVQLLKDEAN